VCVLVEQINYTFFLGLGCGLAVCNEDEIEPCLKLKRLQILCENVMFRPLVEAITRSECGSTSSNLGPYLGLLVYYT
jgi:hypothetical protein